MRAFLKEVGKHLKLMMLFTRRYLISQMEYRGNFFTFLVVESIILTSKLLYVMVTYNTGVVIGGLPPEAILMFTGTFFIISAIYGALFMLNFFGFRNLVRDGGLDLYMTKPVSLQFMATVSTIDLAVPIPNMTAGIILVVNAWKKLSIPVNIITIGGYLVFVLGGIVVIYGILLFPQLFSFWLINVDAINDIAAELSNFNIMPMMIYKKWMQTVGIFIIPIFVVSNFPPLFVMGKLSPMYIAWGVIVPVLIFVLIRVFWKFAIRHYSSATS